MEDIVLKIIVTSRFVHPQLGGNEIHVNEFEMGEALAANNYYIKQRKNEEGNESFMFTSIDIVNKKS